MLLSSPIYSEIADQVSVKYLKSDSPISILKLHIHLITSTFRFTGITFSLEIKTYETELHTFLAFGITRYPILHLYGGRLSGLWLPRTRCLVITKMIQ